MKISYNHLVNHIKENPSIEMVSESLFQLGHEHEIDGDILDMELTPNRGDCLSVKGLLRDLSVFYTVNLKEKIYNEKIDELQLDFENLSHNTCPKISFLKMEIDKIPKEYNQYLNDYFMKFNLNKNNFFTDVSNYLSYETGQPTHCYDATKINGKLVLQESEINQEFHTLLDKKINLSDKNSFFSINDEIVNLAGVVGGKNTACSSFSDDREVAMLSPARVLPAPGTPVTKQILFSLSNLDFSITEKISSVVSARFLAPESERAISSTVCDWYNA